MPRSGLRKLVRGSKGDYVMGQKLQWAKAVQRLCIRVCERKPEL